jgi:galactoside O-acetyltransferase
MIKKIFKALDDILRFFIIYMPGPTGRKIRYYYWKRKLKNNSVVKRIENKNFKLEEGELIIGNGVHIGIGNIIQAHGGIYIGNNVTTSAGVKMYSLSNYPYDENDLKTITYANCMATGKISYIMSPIVIEDGVWIALNCIVLGGTIGKNSFISSNSIVYKDIPENSYASGIPARKIKDRFQMKAQ